MQRFDLIKTAKVVSGIVAMSLIFSVFDGNRCDGQDPAFEIIELNSDLAETLIASHGGEEEILGDTADSFVLVKVNFDVLKTGALERQQVPMGIALGGKGFDFSLPVPIQKRGMFFYDIRIDDSTTGLLTVRNEIVREGETVRRFQNLTGVFNVKGEVYFLDQLSDNFYAAKKRKRIIVWGNGERTDPELPEPPADLKERAEKAIEKMKMKKAAKEKQKNKGGKKQSGIDDSENDEDEIEIVVGFFFTSQAATAVTDPKTFSEFAVAGMNQAISLSGVSDVTVSLGYFGTVNYNEINNNVTMLGHFQHTCDSNMDDVHNIRKDNELDFCFLVTEQRFPGQAYRMREGTYQDANFYPYAFGTGSYEWIKLRGEFTHEFAHCFGCCDEKPVPYDPAIVKPVYDYAFPHKLTVGATTLGTIMNADFADKIDYFSNPNVDYMSVPTGVSGESENAKVIENKAPFVAGFSDSLAP